MHAFRCRHCGRLHDAAHAGLSRLPRSCRVCPRGGADADWEVLADATAERLAELGLTAEQVCRHTPDPEADRLHNLGRCKEALTGLAEKEAAWKARPLADWEADLAAMHAKLDALDAEAEVDPQDHREHARREHERETLRQQIQGMLDKEWGEADVEHRKELEEAVARDGVPKRRPPRQVFRGARQRQGFRGTA